MALLATLMSVYLLTSVSIDLVDAGMCSSSSCLNGGKMIMPNSVFGYCRCRCPPHFQGPKCQFVSKRVDDDFASRLQAVDEGDSHDDKRVFSRLLLKQIVSPLHGKHVRENLTNFHAH